MLFAIVPSLLFALSLLAMLGLGDVWRLGLAPQLLPLLGPAAVAALSEAVEGVLGATGPFWLTGGLLIALWEISGAVRAAMGALNRVYRADSDRPLRRRLAVSLTLAAAMGLCFLVAAVLVRAGPLSVAGLAHGPALAVLDFVVRWGLGIALLLLAVGLLVRYGPVTPQPFPWVTFGSALTVGTWILASLAFGAYLSSVSPYASIFGSLASIIVLMTYIYLSAIAFLAGVQLDAFVRQEVEEDKADA